MAISLEDVFSRRRRFAGLAENSRGLVELGTHVLATFNADPLLPLLGESLERIGIWSKPKAAPFGQIAGAIMDPASDLYKAQPQLVVLIVAVEDALAAIYQRPASMSAEAAGELVEARLQELRQAINLLHQRLPKATTLLVPIRTDRVPSANVLQMDSPDRGQWAAEKFLGALGEFGHNNSVVVVDFDTIAKSIGWSRLRDERMWYLGRMRLGPIGFAYLADKIAETVAAARGLVRKVCVVDLDNTLWGGVVGEVGPSGIELGGDGVGLAYQDFQRELLKLHDSGVLLAVASKNNPEDALAVIESHPAQLLRREHFAALRINWQDKATNLRELAAELNLGLDSFVFLDDNPVERGWIAAAVPEVLVPDLPADAVERPQFVRDLACFRRIAVTDTDRSRLRGYQVENKRREIKAAAANLDDYLMSLEQVADIRVATKADLPRAAQMCQRTNQFNLTTRRYTQAELDAMLANRTVRLFVLSLADRFEDAGMTGLGILRLQNDAAEIDSLLMSCRVLGRRVEDALLACMADAACAAGASRLLGRYIVTEKNSQVADFYTNRGFKPTDDGLFELDLAKSRPQFPNVVQLKQAPAA